MKLEYDRDYPLHRGITLRSGRTIVLETLHQEMTYLGLLMGAPCCESNDADIADALKKAQTYRFGESSPHLIPPPRRDYLRAPGDMSPFVREEYVPEWLPMVRCIATFTSNRPARDPRRDLSMLTVVWYQDEFALPIQEPALTEFLDLDWESLAADGDY
jgi:hypothetical protein